MGGGVKLALRAAVAAFCLATLLWWIGDDEASGVAKLGRQLAQAGAGGLAFAFSLATLDRVLMTFKWQRLLASRGHRLGFWRGLRIYCSSLVWGLFLPSTIGADALRAVLTTRAGLPGDAVVASIAVERMVGFLCSLVASLVGLGIVSASVGAEGPWRALAWAASAALAIASGTALLSFGSAFPRLLARLPEPLRTSRLARTAARLHASYVGYGSERRTLAAFGALSFVEIGVSILFCWACALSLGVEVSLLFVAGALPLSLLVSRLPLSIDGLGVFEGAFAALLWLAGVPESEALAIALLGRAVQLAAWLPWWLAHVLGAGAVRPPLA